MTSPGTCCRGRRIVRTSIAFLLFSLVLSPCRAETATVPSGTPSPHARPNVVVILIDTLRADHLSFYGYPHETAAFLAGLAKKSAVFENAFSTSTWTAPSTASLFTAAYPEQHTVVRGLFAHRQVIADIRQHGWGNIDVNAIPAKLTTLPERMRASGYRTFGIAANFNIGEEMGFARGFDRFERIVARGSALDAKRVTGAKQEDAATNVLATLRTWMPEIRGPSPYFLYLHFNDPHGPLTRHARWYREPGANNEGSPKRPDTRNYERHGRWIPVYDSEIGFVDDVIGSVFKELALDENTIVVVVADHGQAFGDKGVRGGHGPPVGLLGVVNRIPMLVYAPGQGVAARRVKEGVSLVDVAPTLFEMIGRRDEFADRAGKSLVPFLRDEAPDREHRLQELRDRPLFAHVVAPRRLKKPDLRGVIQHGWKLVTDGNSTELYHLDEDPLELRDLAATERDRAAELRLLIETERAAPTVSNESRSVEVNAGDLERLRALGYADD